MGNQDGAGQEMTVFLCIIAFLACITEIKVGENVPSWVFPTIFGMKILFVLGILHLALQSYKL